MKCNNFWLICCNHIVTDRHNGPEPTIRSQKTRATNAYLERNKNERAGKYWSLRAGMRKKTQPKTIKEMKRTNFKQVNCHWDGPQYIHNFLGINLTIKLRAYWKTFYYLPKAVSLIQIYADLFYNITKSKILMLCISNL